jgi:hypothetical protein
LIVVTWAGAGGRSGIGLLLVEYLLFRILEPFGIGI